MAAPAITITGTFAAITGTANGSAVFTLVNYGNNIPTTGSFVVPTVTTTETGASFSVALYGNDVIAPNTTYYVVSFYATDGTHTIDVPYLFTGSGTFDIATLSPINPSLPPYNPAAGLVSPTFANTTTTSLAVTGTGTVSTLNTSVADGVYHVHPSDGELSSVINAKLALAGTSPCLIVLAPGNYSATGTVNINHDRQNIIGAGAQLTQIAFNPASALPFIVVHKLDGSVCYQNVISGFGLNGSGIFQKIGINLIDCSNATIENVGMLTMSGAGSIGIKTNGRELLTLRKIQVGADCPIYIDQNPNASRSVVEDCDVFHFEDLTLGVLDATRGGIEFAAGVTFANFTIDGSNDIAGGKYGIYINTNSVPSAINTNISNVRIEQQVGTPSYAIYINQNARNVRFENVEASNGFYARQTNYLTFANCAVLGNTAVAVDLDSTVGGSAVNISHVVFQNFFAQVGATWNLVSLVPIWQGTLTPTINSGPCDAIYEGVGLTTSTTNQRMLNGIRMADQYTSLQAAINDTPANGWLIIPAGTYSFSSSLTVTQSIKIVGSGPGTILSYTGGVATNCIKLTGSSGNTFLAGTVLSDLTITGNANVVVGLQMQDVSRAQVKNIIVKNTNTYGLYMGGGNVNVIENFICSSNLGAFTTVPVNGLYLTDDGTVGTNATSNTIINPVIEGVSGFGIVLAKADNNTIIGGTSEGNGGAVDIQATATRNLIWKLDCESNTGSYDIQLAGNLNELQGIGDGSGSIATVRVITGCILNRIKGCYIAKLLIAGPNQYTEIADTYITAAGGLTDNDTTTNFRNLYIFNGSGAIKQPDTVGHATGNVGSLASAFLRLKETTDAQRNLRFGVDSRSSGTTNIGNTNGNAWIEATHDTNGAIPLLLNMGFGGNVEIGTAGNTAASFTFAGLSIRQFNNVTRMLNLGWDDTNQKGYVQAVDNGTATKPLQLNPQGGQVQVGSSGLSTPNVTGASLVTASNGNNVTLLYQGLAAAAVTGTAADITLWSYTLPANVLGANASLRITAYVNHSTGTGSVTFKQNFGGGNIAWGPAVAGVHKVQTLIANQNSASSQQWVQDRFNTALSVTSTTSAVATTANQTVSFTFNAAATEQITPLVFTVELIQ